MVAAESPKEATARIQVRGWLGPGRRQGSWSQALRRGEKWWSQGKCSTKCEWRDGVGGNETGQKRRNILDRRVPPVPRLRLNPILPGSDPTTEVPAISPLSQCTWVQRALLWAQLSRRHHQGNERPPLWAPRGPSVRAESCIHM